MAYTKFPEIDVPYMLGKVEEMSGDEPEDETLLAELPLRFSMDEIINIRESAEDNTGNAISTEVVVEILRAANAILISDAESDD